MNKYQEALKELEELVHSELDGTKLLTEHLKHINTLQELVDEHKQLKKENQKLKEAIKILKDKLEIGFKKDNQKIAGEEQYFEATYYWLLQNGCDQELDYTEYQLLKEVFEDD